MKTTKMILGFTAAALAGAAIGMLLAPEKGSDLQKKLKNRAQGWLDEIEKLVKNGKSIASDLTPQGEKLTSDLSKN
ncbi:MAG TPA: YtxH domain-containing protein [Cyclobacteriaceae bacterium]|jgi:gas vesicle protein|nr:YtxH domain-containing protein [Cyclobacteriaceae bacterium]